MVVKAADDGIRVVVVSWSIHCREVYGYCWVVDKKSLTCFKGV